MEAANQIPPITGAVAPPDSEQKPASSHEDGGVSGCYAEEVEGSLPGCQATHLRGGCKAKSLLRKKRWGCCITARRCRHGENRRIQGKE